MQYYSVLTKDEEQLQFVLQVVKQVLHMLS